MRARLPLLAVLLALLASCGGDEKSAAPSKPAATAGGGGVVVQVKMKDIKFVPEAIAAKVGQTIRWTNDDSVAHNVTAKSGADFSSDTLTKGKTFETELEKTGTINYVCTIHPGQKGTITVEG